MRVFAYLPPFYFQILDFIYWTFLIFYFDLFWMAWHWKPAVMVTCFQTLLTWNGECVVPIRSFDDVVFVVTGRVSLPHLSAYCITKYGVEAFSDALRREMSPWGVLVSILEPGSFQTGITHPIPDLVKQLWNNLSPEMKEDYVDKRLDGSKSWMLL